MKRAVIVGCDGQDGRLLYERLSEQAYTLVGIGRKAVRTSGNSWPAETIDISEPRQVSSLIGDFQPHEVYYLAAVHNAAEDTPAAEIRLFLDSSGVNSKFPAYFLEAIRCHSKATKMFYAASSHLFKSSDQLQDEKTPISPTCIYGITKATGLFTCRYYREKHAVFATTGILYNHESSYRRDNFVSKKIIKGALAIKNKTASKLVLGDLNAEIDWGYAPDYVEAMQQLLALESAGEYIIATGQSHTVLDFVKAVFELLQLDWEKHVVENKTIIHKPSNRRIGNPAKLTAATGWRPKTDFRQMVEALLANEGAFD